VPGPDPFSLFAYGPAPGVELIPYFLGLLALVGSALLAILLSPLTALLRLFRGARGAAPVNPAAQPTTAPVPEPPGEGKDTA
jgi:hypothetical protein